MSIHKDMETIIDRSLAAVMPDKAVDRALKDLPEVKGDTYLLAFGKAAWRMAKASYDELGRRIKKGMVITKYGHSQGPIGDFTIREAGHPLLDENSIRASREAIAMVDSLSKDDLVIVLISGGGSALFEDPLVSLEDLANINDKLLKAGAEITQINTIRKRLSRVKGGRLAQIIAPARVYSIILSDIIGDPIDMIASGPTYPDQSSSEEALYLADKYSITDKRILDLLKEETPKSLDNIETLVAGSVTDLAHKAKETAISLGYTSHILTKTMTCQAREAGSLLGSIAKNYQGRGEKFAFIFGGETVVEVKGSGKGGRNQELALAAAAEIEGLEDVLVFSLGSDGTDGPTDAAGGWVDGRTVARLGEKSIKLREVLDDNDSYHALKAIDQLIMTGPTGTNVNDMSLALIGS